ncbi:hypothetical protein [Streptomyces sp. NPDC047014]|uniref:hypothetical protein n=1 Tax=Streptomyces sp. NPDC047014 TaxID=3155736 RepID=UPI0033C0B54C
MPSTAAARRTGRLTAAVCAAALLCGGCSGAAAEPRPAQASVAGSASAAASAAPSEAAPPGTSIEAIATAIGCTPQINVEAEELREGGCQNGPVAYRMLTFAAQGGLRAWLDEARAYGGAYLVGDRWVVTAPKEALEPLRGKIGGSVETGDTHGAPAGSPAPGTAPGGGHAGHTAPTTPASGG